jgi:hypothetical protein
MDMSTEFQPRYQRAAAGVDTILSSTYESLSIAIDTKKFIKMYQHGNLDNLLALADGELGHSDFKKGRATRRERVVRAILPEWWLSNGDVMTEDNIKLCRKRIGIQLAHFVRGEEHLDDAVQTYNEWRADLEEFLELSKANKEDLSDGKYAQRVRPKTGRFMELQAKLRDPKCMEDLKEAQVVIDMVAKMIPRISMKDKDRVWKEIVPTLQPGSKVWKDAAHTF